MALFIGAVGQHVGKTSTCLGLRAVASKQWSDVHYYKPLGQKARCGIEIDSALMGSNGSVQHCVHLGRKDTQRRLDDSTTWTEPPLALEGFRKDVAALREGSSSSFTLIEGSGHMGVGGVVGHNNAQIAAALGVPVVLVANGGVGSTVDQLLLNAALCEKHGAAVVGCVLNRVKPTKMDRITDATVPILKANNIPVLGIIPDIPDADRPTFFDLGALGAIPVSSPKTNGALFETFELVTMDIDMIYALLNREPEDKKRRCLVIHASRHEHVLGMVALLEHLGLGAHYAVLLTGTPGCGERLGQLMSMLQQSSLSIYRIESPTLDVVDRIRSTTSKMNPQDQAHVERITSHYAHYLKDIFNNIRSARV